MFATVATGKIWIEKRVGERAGLNAVQKGIIPAPARNVSVIPRAHVPYLSFYMRCTTSLTEIIELLLLLTGICPTN
jgi:hypothetical protein